MTTHACKGCGGAAREGRVLKAFTTPFLGAPATVVRTFTFGEIVVEDVIGHEAFERLVVGGAIELT